MFGVISQGKSHVWLRTNVGYKLWKDSVVYDIYGACSQDFQNNIIVIFNSLTLSYFLYKLHKEI